jgi:hypothetical protein
MRRANARTDQKRNFTDDTPVIGRDDVSELKRCCSWPLQSPWSDPASPRTTPRNEVLQRRGEEGRSRRSADGACSFFTPAEHDEAELLEAV